MSLDTPWGRARKLRSEKQEERLGKMEGGSRQINSGRSAWFSRRDNRLYEFLIEARDTQSGSYRIEKDEWVQLRRDALREPPGLKPAMQVTIGDLDLIVVELKDFHAMYVQLISLEKDGDEGDEEE